MQEFLFSYNGRTVCRDDIWSLGIGMEVTISVINACNQILNSIPKFGFHGFEFPNPGTFTQHLLGLELGLSQEGRIGSVNFQAVPQSYQMGTGNNPMNQQHPGTGRDESQGPGQ
nr:transcription factor TCP20-like [Ipomoea batatas]